MHLKRISVCFFCSCIFFIKKKIFCILSVLLHRILLTQDLCPLIVLYYIYFLVILVYKQPQGIGVCLLSGDGEGKVLLVRNQPIIALRNKVSCSPNIGSVLMSTSQLFGLDEINLLVFGVFYYYYTPWSDLLIITLS